ncbi:unnamed protein product [Clavelina lepadiformis]|uniref:UPAR/Ly6 domain-containing protein n=1 Tax=Clavelina lepadiformis TaxID=159417 RepID=A0ABP0G3J2_CLALP
MRSFQLFFVIFALLMISNAGGLRCYEENTCKGHMCPSSGTHTQRTKTCARHNDVCTTINITDTQNGSETKIHTRGCYPSGGVDLGREVTDTSVTLTMQCRTDLCNNNIKRGSSTAIKGSFAVISASVLAAVLCAR